MEYAFKYWYTPLINSLDIFLGGFLVNAFIKCQKLKLEDSEHITDSHQPLILPKSTTKYIAIILLILLYLFTADHLYHQELWGLPSRPGGWRMPQLDTAWTPSIGDFNGDGKTDIFWHNQNTGDSSFWLMDGTNVTQTAEPSLPTGWTNYTHA